MASETLDDRVLVAQAAAGSEPAFRTLYRAYVRPVYWVAHGLLGDPRDAEDVTQDTFVIAWRKLPSFRLEGTSLLPWLATIARLQAANRLRRRQRERAATVPTDADLPAPIDVERQVIDAQTAAAIVREVSGLSALDRDIFRLCAAEGWAYQAAAEELGVTHAVVRNRLSRIRARVRTAVTDTESS